MPQPSSPINHKDSGKRIFNHLALGGTFDHFHRGHREFLSEAFRVSRKVTIGVTGDAFGKKLHLAGKIESFIDRKNEVLALLKSEGLAKRGTIVMLEDPYGPTLTDERFEALLVTAQTIAGARKINSQRTSRGKKRLKIIRFPLVKAADGRSISSRRVRNGEITREGVVYLRELRNATPIRLPKELRSAFREPFGIIHPPTERNIYESMRKVVASVGKKDGDEIICVGDLVTHSFVKLGSTPRLSIVDFMIQRQKRFSSIADIGPFNKLKIEEVTNKAGTITKKLVLTIDKALQMTPPVVVVVKGEEDLAVLPCVLLAPLGTVVIYGHFLHGVISVEVTEQKKQEALKLLQQLHRMSEE